MATETEYNDTPPSPACWWMDLPETDYQTALDLQLAVVAAKTEGGLDVDVVLCLEHPRVFTLGRHGGRENLCVSDDFLADKGVRVMPTDRGGNITYHGPGQLVVYPILHLSRRRIRVVDFVAGLEAAMIRTAAHWGVPAGTDPANRGVWVGADKLGSIGITVRRGVSFHGLALNVNTDMEPFGWINPCGLNQVRMTSIERYLGHPVPMAEARRVLAGHLAEELETALTEISLSALCEKIGQREATMSKAQHQMPNGG